MKNYIVFLCMIMFAAWTAAFGQTKASDSKKTGPAAHGAKKAGHATAANGAKAKLLSAALPEDACFRDPLAGSLWAVYLDDSFSHAEKSFNAKGGPQNLHAIHSKLLQDLKTGKPRLTLEDFKIAQQVQQVVSDNSVPQAMNNSPTPQLVSAKRPVLQNTSSTAPIEAVFQPIGDAEKDGVMTLAKSVGRLQVKDEGGPNGTEWGGVGTAFVVAPGVIATNCHVIPGLITGTPGHWDLDEKYAGKIAIDFSTSGESDDDARFVITKLYPPPEEVGFDVVFLQVEKKNHAGKDLPAPLTLSSENLATHPQPLNAAALLIGYPGRGDVLDTRAAQIYGSLGDLRYNKIIVPGEATTVQSCKVPLNVVLNNVSTTAGQSGSPIIDRTSHLVIGVHACCANHFVRTATHPPLEHFACASKRATVSNQAISSWSIWQEPNLTQTLKDNGVQQTTAASSVPH